MSPLHSLHRNLALLRHKRRLVRWAMATAVLLLAVFWALATMFAFDVGFVLNAVQRILLMVLGAALVAWLLRRYAAPWLGVRETETDVALVLERELGIDTDLVAALQFDRGLNRSWGSEDLREAVITRIAEASPTLNLRRGVNYAPLGRIGRYLAISTILGLGVAALYPQHVRTFFARFLVLSPRHYPTKTQFATVRVNDSEVWEAGAATMQPRDIRAAKGHPVRFQVVSRGELPESGMLELWSLEDGAKRTISLERVGGPGAPDAKSTTASYAGELPHLIAGFQYMLRLGDARTDPAQVQVMEPPVAELSVSVTPPEYARSVPSAESSPRHLSVLPGSRVALQLRPLKSSRFKTVTAEVQIGDERQLLVLVAKSDDTSAPSWTLPRGTPFDNLQSELRYELQVVDQNGLGLESPLGGTIRLKADRAPSATISVVHRVVLPSAQPVIEYRLNDDYGIASATMQLQIERQAVAPDEDRTAERSTVAVPIVAPLAHERLPHRGQVPLDLEKLQLKKGDQLKVTMVVTDHRGSNSGASVESEPILLEISDEAGVLAAITEADERSEKRLNDVIKQQLDVGGKR